jgi:hypothetical protein
MKIGTLLIPSALCSVVYCGSASYLPHVTPEKLQELITLENLLAGSQKLQDLADANGGNRAFGSAGHNATVDYLYDTLTTLDYYDVSKQEFVELFSGGNATLSANGADYAPGLMTYTPSGHVKAPLVVVSNFGCAVTDFPADIEGDIALIREEIAPSRRRPRTQSPRGRRPPLYTTIFPASSAGR